MRTMEAIRRSAVGIAASATIAEAATVMDRAGVGALGIVDGDRLIGIVTDRDIVRRAIATGMPVDARIDAVMTMPALTIDADADLHEAFALFRTHAVRRLAVSRAGSFVGVIAVDDLMVDLASDLADLTRPVLGQVLFGHHDQNRAVLPT